MSDPLVTSFDRQLAALHDRLRTDWRWPSPEAGFAWHINRISGNPLTAGCSVDITGLEHARLDQAPLLASVGYILPKEIPPALQTTLSSWMSGLHRLAARNAFAADRQSFAYRPYEVLGICLGASRIRALPAEISTFLRNTAVQICADQGTTTWRRLLASCAGVAVGASWPSDFLVNTRDCDLPELALFKWLMSQAEFASVLAVDEGMRRNVARAIMERALIDPTASLDIGQVAIVHTSLRAVVHETIGGNLTDSWLSGNVQRSAVRVIENICRRFPLLAQQLIHRHAKRATLKIRDEYDVQDLLHALLVLHFDDVRSEEWSPSYAGTSTRMDFLLKKERIVIEVKMTRKGLDQKKVLEELAVDKMRYRTHQDCRVLICFVYDPLRMCHNPVALERDASERINDLDVIVIVSPHGN